MGHLIIHNPNPTGTFEVGESFTFIRAEDDLWVVQRCKTGTVHRQYPWRFEHSILSKDELIRIQELNPT